MKHLVLLFTTCLFYTINAQSFVVTPDGLRDKADESKSYIVLNVDGKSAKELFDRALQYVNETYKNPDEVIKAQRDGEYLKFSTYVSPFVPVKNLISIETNVMYSTELKFKDGKVRLEIVSFDMKTSEQARVEFSGSPWGSFIIYKTNGDLKQKETKEGIEEYFNTKIGAIRSFLSSEGQKEDW